jgi:hypothetical protein
MTKIGGRLTDQTASISIHGRDVPHVVFEITRESFAAGPLSS